MPKRLPLQTTFEGGVASPLIYGRSDFDKYRKTAKRMLNMHADSRGPAISRFPFEYQYDIGESTDRDGRLFTFRATPDKSYVIAVTESDVIVTDAFGLIESDNLITNGEFNNGGTGWTVDTSANGSVVFTGGKARLVSGADVNGGSYAAIEQQVAITNTANTHELRINPVALSVLPGTNIEVKVGTTQGGNDIVQRTVSAVSSSVISFVPNNANVWVRFSVRDVLGQVGGTPEEPILGFLSTAIELEAVGLVDISVSTGPNFVTFTSPYTEEQLTDLQVEMAPDLQRMYFVHREVPVQQLEVDFSTNPETWTFVPSVFTWGVEPDPWTTNYPGAITFFQGRLWLASTVDEPVALWGSVPGRDNYNDFDPGTSQPDDAIKVVMARNADIQWIEGSKVLYVGCDNSEHVITSDGPVIIPSDIETNQLSAYGSARIKTNWISNEIAFVSWDQRRVRATNYVSNSQSLASIDLTFASEHLTIGKVSEVHQASHPVNRLWCPLADGTFIVGTVEPDYQVNAWAPHSLPGLVKSMTILEEQGMSVVYALVLRNSQLRLLRQSAKEFFMDEYVDRGYATSVSTIDGLDHLEGETVQIIGDGALYPDAVVNSGEVTIDGSAMDFTVGLSMFRLVETMLVDNAGPGFSSAATMKGWNRIFVRILESAIPVINGFREPDRTPSTPMNTGEPTRTQDIRVENLGWDYDGTILITQDLPFNLTVTSVFGELSEESL